MATIRLIPSSYSLSSTSYLSVSNASNMYNNTDNTTYATVTNNRARTSSYYIYLGGFNFSDIPTGATVNSFTIKIKISESGVTTSTSYRMYLADGTTATSDYASTMPGTTASVITFDNVSSSWDTLSGYDNLAIRINTRRANQNTTSYLYIYGAEILVDYSLPYTVTSTITNGTLLSTNPVSVSSGNSTTILFQGNDDYEFKSMTVNGVNVTPSSYTPSASSATLTYSTNYGIYNSNELSGAFDSDSSTCFWSNEVQASGKYILMSFDSYINLNSFSTTTTGSSTDYICSGTSLQVSDDGGSTWTSIGTFDGNATSSFTNLNQTKINAIRIYWNSGVDYWLYIDTINIGYTDYVEDTDITAYQYTINNITSDQTVIIIFGPSDQLYIKVNNIWYPITTVYRKISGTWTEIEYTHSDNEKLVKQN